MYWGNHTKNALATIATKKLAFKGYLDFSLCFKKILNLLIEKWYVQKVI